jgi:transposase
MPKMKDERRAKMLEEALRMHLLEGQTARAIAKKLGISRNTVRELLGRGPARAAPSQAARQSVLLPYLSTIQKLLEECPDIQAPTVLERLRPWGYTGGITIVRQHLRKIRPRQSREPFLTLHFQPGAAMQVDWADFGFALPGCARRVSALVVALCYSRYLYLEFVLSQAFGTFVRTLDRALAFLEGTTAVDIFDNMKTVVLSRTGPTPRFNPNFLEYARSRGFAMHACTPGKGNEKGIVERPIGFVRQRFWPGRRFTSLLDLNQQAFAWRNEFANNRIHEVTGKVPSLVFKNEERTLLRPLTNTFFETDDIDSAGVTKQFRIRFDRNLYSVPPRLVGQTLVVRGNDESVSMYLGPKQVALHNRCWGVGEDCEDLSHREAALEMKPRARMGGLPSHLAQLDDIGVEYFKIFVATTRSIHREITRITFLMELFGTKATASAMNEVMRTGHVGAEYVEYVLRYKRNLTPDCAPLRLGRPDLDQMNFGEPDLSVYDALVPTQKTLDPGEPPANPEGSETPDKKAAFEELSTTPEDRDEG